MSRSFLRTLRGLVALGLGYVLVADGAAAQAQLGTIAGQVTEQGTGTPLAGARVLLGATNRSAVTNVEGRYTLAGVPAGRHEIRISLIGYVAATQSVSVTAGGIATADFQMRASAVSLDALVVTATGEQRAKEIANVVERVNADSLLEQAPVSNFGQLLQGRTANVQVLPASGTTGTGTRIRIRGLNSISLGNEPVYYVDGVRVESGSNSFSVGTGGQSISRINDINPEEIESVEIVKGPSASTLYGTQAANGVVRITTKRGKSGRTNWNVYSEGGILRDNNNYPTNYLSWGRLVSNNNLTQCNIFAAHAATPTCVIDSLTSLNILESDLGINGTGYRGQAGMQVSGGTESVRYFVSGEYEEEIGHIRMPDFEYGRIATERNVTELPYNQFRPNALERVALRANMDANLSRNVDISLKSGLVLSDTRLPQNDNNVTGILPSGLFGRACRGGCAFGGDYAFERPGEVFARLSTQDITRVTGAANAQWRVTPSITTRATVGLDYTNRLDQGFQALDEGPFFATNRLGVVIDNRQSIAQVTVDVNATGSFVLSPLISSKTSVGVQYLRDYAFQVNANGSELSPGGRTISFTSVRSASEATAETITLGAYVEQVFGWRDRVFVTGALRADDNSAFGRDFSAVVYPKFQVSWVPSEEPFFPQALPLDNLRLRAAYGASGQQPGTTDALKFFQGQQATVAGTNLPGLVIGALGNDLLKPERSAELELGFDAGFLDDRASLQFTYYNKKSNDALINVPQPPSLGGPANRIENIGAVRNSGVEATLNFTVTPMSSLSFDVAVSGSRNTNELLDLGSVPPIGGGTVRHVEGYPLFGYWDRPLRGFQDRDGDGVIEWNADPNLTEVFVGDTAEFLGYSIPRTELSLNLGVNLFHNRLRLGGLLDYRGDFRQNNFTEYFRCTSGAANNCQAINDPTAPLWLQARAIAARTAGAAPGTGATAAGYIEDASFMKLRELSLTYFAPESWARALRATRLSITVAGRNLKTWTDYTGIDPELNGNGASDSPIDFLTQPPITFWTFKINLGF
jgi:TonB-linked SusC/RagA family outer membrane protein